MNAALALLLVAAVSSGWQSDSSREPTARRPTDDRYSYNAQNTAAADRDQYSQPPATTSQPATITRDQPQPPAITTRVQDAAAETATTLREGIEAGIQAAGGQLNRAGGRLLERSTSVGQGVGRQLQDLSSGAGQQLKDTVGNVRNVAGQTVGAARDTLDATGQALGVGELPPLPELDASSTLPPLPPLPTTTPAATTSTTPMPPAGDDRYGTSPTAPAGSSWASDWSASTSATTASPGTNAAGSLGPIQNVPANPSDAAAAAPERRATIRRDDDAADRQATDVGLVPIQPQDQPAAATGPSTQPNAASQWGDPWSGPDPWAQPPQQSAQPAASSPPAPQPQPPAPASANVPAGTSGGVARPESSTGVVASASSTTPFAEPPGVPPASQPQGTPTRAEPQGVSDGTTAGDGQPWMPLVLVGFGLAGSLGANLFLAFSYIDARRRCHALAQKTADTFRHAKEAA